MSTELINFKEDTENEAVSCDASHKATSINVGLMKKEIETICNLISDTNNMKFVGDINNTYDIIDKYIEQYDRFLYSEVTNIIFAKLLKDEDSNISSNLEALLQTSYQKSKKENTKTNHSIFKLYDHINLACKQFSDLKESDQNYTMRFQKRLEPEINKVQREVTNQLLTLVGIFTALAFLLFGGISSLENIFSGIIGGAEITEIFLLGLIWGIALIDIMYVFLFLVGKMTDKEIGDKTCGSIAQKHALIVYCNLFLLSLMFIGAIIYIIDRWDLASPYKELLTNKYAASVLLVLIVLITINIINKIIKFATNDESVNNKE